MDGIELLKRLALRLDRELPGIEAFVVDETFRRKWEIALAHIDVSLGWGVRKHVVLADAGYGDIIEFRDGLSCRGLDYVVAVSGTGVVWPPGSSPRIPQRRRSGSGGRPHSRYRDKKYPPIQVRDLATCLEYRSVRWREESKGWQRSQFAATRVRNAHGHWKSASPGDEQWLLCEWPEAERAPSTPSRTRFSQCVVLGC